LFSLPAPDVPDEWTAFTMRNSTPETRWLPPLFIPETFSTPFAAQWSASSNTATTMAPVFLASSMPSSPKWSKWPCVAAMTSTRPHSKPFGNFGLLPIQGSIAMRTPFGDSIKNAEWPSQVSFPPNRFSAT
jgi:hypothetical protein